MFHSRIADQVVSNGRTHPMDCRCDDCAFDHDPIAYRRARRIVRLQAVILIAATIAFYFFVAANAPAIAASFEVSL